MNERAEGRPFSNSKEAAETRQRYVNIVLLWDKMSQPVERHWEKCPPECLQNCPREDRSTLSYTEQDQRRCLASAACGFDACSSCGAWACRPCNDVATHFIPRGMFYATVQHCRNAGTNFTQPGTSLFERPCVKVLTPSMM